MRTPSSEIAIEEGVKNNVENEDLVSEETLECCVTLCNEITNAEIFPSTLRIPIHIEGKIIL